MKPIKRIIITDDDRGIQDVLRTMLEHKGYEVTIFDDGTPLLDGGFPIPDLFILDKQLPGVDGLDVCRFLKAQDATRHIPVLMLSASPQHRSEVEAACVDSFLEKPFKMKKLREAVVALIGEGQ